jgi:hypothetical protein
MALVGSSCRFLLVMMIWDDGYDSQSQHSQFR